MFCYYVDETREKEKVSCESVSLYFEHQTTLVIHASGIRHVLMINSKNLYIRKCGPQNLLPLSFKLKN